MVNLNLAAAATLALAAVFAPTAAFPQDAAAPTEIVPAAPLPDVPRNQTLILGWGITSPIGVTNPWAMPGYTHQEGNVFMWEPLMYFGIFADKYIPWLADSMEYTSRRLHRARDQAEHGRQVERRHAGDVRGRGLHVRRPDEQRQAALPRAVRAVRRVGDGADDLTVVVKFKIPAPRFKFEVLTLKFDTGIPIVPEHCAVASRPT